MLYFFNYFTTTSFFTPFHDLGLQSQTWAMDASLIQPVGVKSVPADCIHNVHSFFIRALKGLFTDTSRGCSWLVGPPGFQASGLPSPLQLLLHSLWHRLWGDQKQAKPVFKVIPPGLHDRTLLHQIFRPSFIHPSSCTWTINLLGIFSFRNVFLLKMITGGSFVPSAQQARTTVKWVCSRPLVLTAMVFAPLTPTALLGGTSNGVGPHPYRWLGTAQSCKYFED